jgi:DNA replication protein DnaC
MKQMIFPRYRGKGLDDFEVTNTSLEKAVEVTRSYISDLEAMKRSGKGITFAGQNGVGKTHLACAVMAAVGDAGYKYECIELSSYIDLNLEMFRVTSRLKVGYEEDEERSFELDKRLRFIKNRADFVLLDDLGREHESQSGWSNERVFDLLRFRHNRNLPTLITTNMPFDELDNRYTQGLGSFLHEATILVGLESEDYRCGMGR